MSAGGNGVADGAAADESPGRKHVARLQRAAAVAAEEAQREGGAAAEIGRHVEAAADRQAGAAARTAHGTHAKQRTGRDLDRPKSLHRRAVERGVHVGAGQRHDGRRVKAQRRSDRRALESGRPFGVPHQPIGQPERQRVHRPRRGNADVPQAEAPRPVLHRGLRAPFDHLDGSRPVVDGRQQARVHVAGDELGKVERLDQIGAVGLDARQAAAAQRLDQPGPRLVARRAARDHLRQQRIVVGGHLAAGVDAGLDAQPFGLREGDLGQHADARLKPARRILRVDPRLDGGAERRGRDVQAAAARPPPPAPSTR